MNIYSPLHPAAFFMIQRRQRIIRKIFAENDIEPEKTSLLEIGCGGGQWLAEFQTFGFMPQNLAGIELDGERASKAAQRVKEADVREGNGADLPWDDNSFDIVFQSTVFTSVLDDEIRKKIADEMKRVCKKDGFILWYDFAYNNPKNPNVRKVSKSEIKSLFEPFKCEFTSVTLAPQITRKIAPVAWLGAELLETFCPFLRTHIIAKIHSGGKQ
jgi:ubiquinone/menaquinone biosynthesis C-methylase UbiE